MDDRACPQSFTHSLVDHSAGQKPSSLVGVTDAPKPPRYSVEIHIAERCSAQGAQPVITETEPPQAFHCRWQKRIPASFVSSARALFQDNGSHSCFPNRPGSRTSRGSGTNDDDTETTSRSTHGSTAYVNICQIGKQWLEFRGAESAGFRSFPDGDEVVQRHFGDLFANIAFRQPH